MSLFGKKTFRIEVVDGIDIESALTLTGDRMSVGTGPGDDLRLGEADVVAAQVVFQRKAGDWEYAVSDRGTTIVSGGHPRTGKLRAAQELRLGGVARLVVRRVAAPVEAPAGGTAGQGATPSVPLGIALPVLGLIVVGAFLVAGQLQRDGQSAPLLASTRWFAQDEPLEPAVDRCLAASEGLEDIPVGRNAPDWAFREWLRAADPAAPAARAARAALIDETRDSITRAHFLHLDGRNAEASAIFRRLEYVIPMGSRECPILAAARRDLAILQMMARN